MREQKPSFIMKKEIKNKYPEWIKDNNKYYMCLTDDLDSYFSCLLLQQIKGYEISHFYTFSKLYKADGYVNNVKICGIDMDLLKGRCWSNHVTKINNPKSANLNVIQNIGINNYYSKYCGSTLLQIISYYDYDISDLSDEAKMVLLCVDSTFLMYGFNEENCKHWLVDILNLPDMFQLCKEHSREEFKQLIDKYNLKNKIYVDEYGELKTGIDLEGLSNLFDLPFLLPRNKLTEISAYGNVGMDYYKYNNFKNKLEENGGAIFSQALVSKNYIKLSYER